MVIDNWLEIIGLDPRELSGKNYYQVNDALLERGWENIFEYDKFRIKETTLMGDNTYYIKGSWMLITYSIYGNEDGGLESLELYSLTLMGESGIIIWE